MTSATQEKPVTRARAAARLELMGLQNWALSILLLAPLSLLWADGLWFAFGVGYLIAYVGIMAIPTSLNLLLMYDALRVLLGRPATVLPWMMGMYLVYARAQLRARSNRAHFFAKLSVLGNPLVLGVSEFWGLASTYRPQVNAQIVADAERYASQVRLKPLQIIVFEVHEVSRDIGRLAQC